MMDDRVRIYDLAKRMNMSNQDIIQALRALGYDVKSHSSTIDSNAVNLLISSFKKKKEKETKPKENKELSRVKTVPTPKVEKPATKTQAIEPAAKPLAVKPRVLSRYRKAEVTPAVAAEGTTSAVDTTEITAPIVEPLPIPTPAATTVTEPISPVVEEPPLHEYVDLSVTANSPTAKLNLAEPIRPLTPSVPIRIAAPSIRAMPPRPPKTHRHLHTPERPSGKKDDKVKSAAIDSSVLEEPPKLINLTQAETVQDLAQKMNVPLEDIITRLLMKGIMRTVNQLVELELAIELANEMGYEISTTVPQSESLGFGEESGLFEQAAGDNQENLVTRPPVVTIMGHVDHGKTSLLDAIRQTKFLLTDAEAGGITQHIGAYHVEVPHEDGTMRQIVFLDTPGHEAFTAMRARGAKATDIAILVVAADDGVMPQTIEAIDHAKAAGVPIIVAVNKIDKPGADPDRVLGQLTKYGLMPEKFGGDTVTVNVSAKKRTGLDELLEMILLVADLQELKANPDKPASGVIIEAELSRGKGAVATALVSSGTLREADFIVIGSKSGKVRALFDDRGQRVKAAGPSMPVEVLGLDEVPQAGDRFEVVADNQALKYLVEKRKLLETGSRNYHVTLESLHDLVVTGEVKELNVIIKADVQGTAEAIADSVRQLPSKEVRVRVLRTASGDISENDVNLAASSNAIIIGFNVQPDHNAAKVSEAAGVDIRTYNVIYQITDDLLKAIEGLIEPIRQETLAGSAEVRQIFKLGKKLTIAGCMVTSGKIMRGALARLERDGQIIYEGKIETLKRFKDDVREVAQGFECGLSLDKFSEMQEGDTVNAFIIQESKKVT
jgi:translation initiation factor IF-2